jgi:hypothetical protein
MTDAVERFAWRRWLRWVRMVLAGGIGTLVAMLALIPAAAVSGIELGGSVDEAALVFHGSAIARAATVFAATLVGLIVAALLAWPAYRAAALVFGFAWGGLLTDETWDVASSRTVYILGTVAIVAAFVVATRHQRSFTGEQLASSSSP